MSALPALTLMVLPSSASWFSSFYNGAPKVCPKGCKHKGIPVHRKACMHNDQTPSSTASKLCTNRSIPLVEKLPMGASSLGIQYYTGCQLSLISQSALQSLPTSMYTRGASSKVRILTYAGTIQDRSPSCWGVTITGFSPPNWTVRHRV